ncbi:hypothetical protein ACH46N_01430 [Streptomyces pristinaespiralis]|uniref:Uncharacterized protein n=2 Tax=Streptomyces pristinaespiralis TaxID=38300 RepID=B5HF08_STRE2|nr:hypothetical protein [Streptomyces pristinaespiralis]ALC19770.1 hypothetical protein SPRI_1464 [Streptomyces pristinaespiralis]EDY65419.1 conserved hypothetical protein [Streptomyces pristinaespiralis ATCC 25486]QMU17256.1 hypothetical protein H3L99_29630 [Streptomyces pristinaespiralis]
MATERNVRTNIGFYPPQEDGGAWRSNLPSLEDALRQSFPDPVIEHSISPLHGEQALDFEIALAPEVWLTGTSSMEEPDYAYITLVDATADEAAVFATWLRDSFVPSPDLVRFISSLAMAGGEETPWVLPATGGSEEVLAEIRRHIETFDVF